MKAKRLKWPGVVLAMLVVLASCSPQPSDPADENGGGVEPQPEESELLLTSTGFAEGDDIPDAYSCQSQGGQNLSPPLAWTNIPEGTNELALLMADPDAPSGTFFHWIVAGIDPATEGFAEGSVPEGVVQGANDFGSSSYGGPCPPGGETHTYIFTLYALSEASGVKAGVDAQTFMATVDPLKITEAILTAEYGG